MALHHSPRTVTDGLVLCLDAANPRSYSGTGTTWTDLSGRGNNGTLIDGPTFSNNSLTFDGTNDRIHLSSPSNRFTWTPTGSGLNTMSIELWVKSSDTSGNFVSKPWNGNGEYNYRILHSSFSFQIGAQSGSLAFSSLSTGNWENLFFVINSTQYAAYRNGILNTAFTNHNCTTNTPTYGNNNVDLCLMSLYPYGPPWAGNTDFSIQGQMANIKIYNRVLTAAEIRQNYLSLKGRYGL